MTDPVMCPVLVAEGRILLDTTTHGMKVFWSEL